jgi:two-component system, OmpR family, response regulator MprA
MPATGAAPSATPAARVLVVDDDPELREFLLGELAAEGYSGEAAASGQAALLALRQQEWDLVLLDWGLPDFSGVEVCERLRAGGSTTPVLMLTAHDDVPERVRALDAGADDYLTKPFSIAELLARVRAQLRRGSRNGSEASSFSLADLGVDLLRREVKRDGVVLELSQREFDLLAFLIREPERVHSRQAILEAVWGAPFIGDPNLLDVYVGYLRRKIERSGLPQLIHTVRGVGFTLRVGAVKD